jgi:hypothetical protein
MPLVPSLKDGNRSSSRNVVFFVEYRTIDEVRKGINPLVHVTQPQISRVPLIPISDALWTKQRPVSKTVSLYYCHKVHFLSAYLIRHLMLLRNNSNGGHHEV